MLIYSERSLLCADLERGGRGGGSAVGRPAPMDAEAAWLAAALGSPPAMAAVMLISSFAPIHGCRPPGGTAGVWLLA